MIKRCEICGKFFEARRNFEIICDKPQCKKARNKQKHDEWAARNADRVREIRRNSKKRVKARQRANEIKKKRLERYCDEIRHDKEKAISGKSYGEYQVQKTLAAIPKIKTDITDTGKDV